MTMKRLIAKPSGWPCTIDECPPGHFLAGEQVGFKGKCCDDGCPITRGSAGEFAIFENVLVTPIYFEWEEQ